MEENSLNRNLTCVLFPGIVKNDEKALKCLGGIKHISQVYSQHATKRLSLTFQPENPFIKPIFAEPKPVSGMLLKVKVKKTRDGNEVKRQVISTTVVGTVKRMYTFESMADYQYLPIQKEGAGPHQCLLDKILPSGLDDLSFLNEPAPLFLPPTHFTRFDKTTYSYTARRYLPGPTAGLEDPGSDDEMLLASRMSRSLPSSQFNFNLTDEFPTEPHECYLEMKEERIKSHSYAAEEYETVKKMFAERPIWSMNILRYHTKYAYTSLKSILPLFAFNMRTGPWRGLWIRLGYDPRKEPSARFYQSLDFRMRQSGGARSMVRSRDDARHYKRADRLRHVTRRRNDIPGEDDEVSESMAYFRPGLVPAQRQIFYMYCDVQLPEVQAIVAPEPPPGALCHHKRGWLPPGAADACRDLLTKHIMDTLLTSRGGDVSVKLEEPKSDEDSNSDDDNTVTSTATELEEASTSVAVDPTPSTSVT